MTLFFDVETTGLPVRKWGKSKYRDLDSFAGSRIVSIAWRLAPVGTTAQVNPVVHRIVRPDGYQIPSSATAIHGISDERARNEGLPICDVLEEFCRAVRQCVRIVSHNLDFDKAIVKSEAVREHSNSADLLVALRGVEKVCTMRLATDIFALQKWPKLTELYCFLTKRPVEAERLHDASYDVQLCEESYWILERIPPGSTAARKIKA